MYKELIESLEGKTWTTEMTTDELMETLEEKGLISIENFNLHYYTNEEILTAYNYDEFQDRLDNACVLEALKDTAIDINRLYFFYLKNNIIQDTTIFRTADDRTLFFFEPTTAEIENIFFFNKEEKQIKFELIK